MALPQPGSQTSGLWNRERVNSCCFMHPLLWVLSSGSPRDLMQLPWRVLG